MNESNGTKPSDARQTITQAGQAVAHAIESHLLKSESLCMERRASGKFARSERQARSSIVVSIESSRDEAGRFVVSLTQAEKLPPEDVVKSLTFGADAPMPEPPGGAATLG